MLKRRGLAGAVRPEQPDDLARPHLEIEAIDDGALAVLLDEPLRGDRLALHGAGLGAAAGAALVAAHSRPCTFGRTISTFSVSR